MHVESTSLTAVAQPTLNLRHPIVVVTGMFNPAIFNPPWLAANIFGIPAGQTVNIAMAEGLGSGGSTVFLDGVGVSVGFNRLELFATEASEDTLKKLEGALIKIIETLPHTPLGAFGLNFAILRDEVDDNLSDLFKSPEDLEKAYEISDRTSSFKLKNQGIFDLTIERTLNDDGLALNFNFHCSDINPLNYKEMITGSIISSFNEAAKISKEFYDIDDFLPQSFPFPEL